MVTVIDNRRILKNTVYLYIRMFFIMAISLYTVRVVLNQLGVLDYGIFNVVGSVVALCSFLTGSLTAASNRFLTREIVKEDRSSLNKIFSLNITVFGILVLCAIILLETVGLWYVNNKMVIPENRMFAANVVYQLSIITLATTFISIPYNALIITHEQMSIYAYFGIIETLAKLVIAWLLIVCPFDKLIVYALLSSLISILMTVFYYIYCRKHYEESKYRLYWNRDEFSEIFKFISLYFFGSVSAVVRSQGLNLLINAFFLPVINASRAISLQVESAIKRFSDGYFTAAKPQIYKSYANKEFIGLNLLLNRITIVCVFLMMIFVIPISINAEFVLTLWLGEVPDKAVVFLQLILIDSALNVTSEPIILSILATGRQGKYQLCEFVLRCISLPIAYVLLMRGSQPECTVIICIVLSICSVFARIYFLKLNMSEFQVEKYIITLIKITLSIVIVFLVNYISFDFYIPSFLYFLISSVLTFVLMILTFYFITLSNEDKQIINKIIINIKNKII